RSGVVMALLLPVQQFLELGAKPLLPLLVDVLPLQAVHAVAEPGTHLALGDADLPALQAPLQLVEAGTAEVRADAAGIDARLPGPHELVLPAHGRQLFFAAPDVCRHPFRRLPEGFAGLRDPQDPVAHRLAPLQAGQRARLVLLRCTDGALRPEPLALLQLLELAGRLLLAGAHAAELHLCRGNAPALLADGRPDE